MTSGGPWSAGTDQEEQEEEEEGEGEGEGGRGRSSDRLSFTHPLLSTEGAIRAPFPPPYTPSRQKQLFLVECSVVVRVCGREGWREGV